MPLRSTTASAVGAQVSGAVGGRGVTTRRRIRQGSPLRFWPETLRERLIINGNCSFTTVAAQGRKMQKVVDFLPCNPSPLGAAYPHTPLKPSPSLSHSPIPPRPTHPTRPACCDICEARSPHNKNTLGKCLGSNVCLNWPDESHLGPGVCATLPCN